REPALARLQRLHLEQRHARGGMGRADMQVDWRPVAERARLALEQAKLDVESVGRPVQARLDQPVAALHLLTRDAGEIDGAALADMPLLRRPALRMDAAHARLELARRDEQTVARPDAAGHHRAGHHRAGAGDGEGAVDGEAE